MILVLIKACTDCSVTSQNLLRWVLNSLLLINPKVKEKTTANKFRCSERSFLFLKIKKASVVNPKTRECNSLNYVATYSIKAKTTPQIR